MTSCRGPVPAALQFRLDLVPIPAGVSAEILDPVAVGRAVVVVAAAGFDVRPVAVIVRPVLVLGRRVDVLGDGLAGEPADDAAGHGPDDYANRSGRHAGGHAGRGPTGRGAHADADRVRPGSPVIGSSLRSLEVFLSVAIDGPSTLGEVVGQTGKGNAKRSPEKA